MGLLDGVRSVYNKIELNRLWKRAITIFLFQSFSLIQKDLQGFVQIIDRQENIKLYFSSARVKTRLQDCLSHLMRRLKLRTSSYVDNLLSFFSILFCSLLQ